MNPRLKILALAAAAGCTFTAGNGQELIWSFTTPYPVLASPTLATNGDVYIGSYDRYVHALSPTGATVWSTLLPPPIYIYFATYTAVYGTPAAGSDGTLYVPSENGHLLALNPLTGASNWVYSTVQPEGLYTSVAIGPDGTIYFGSYDGNLYAIRSNGTRKWASLFSSTIFGSPAVGEDGTVYCGSDDGKFHALNPATGVKKWTFVTGSSPIQASPAIGNDGSLYLGVGSDSNPTFYSISSAGTTNWTFTAGRAIRSSAALDEKGNVYFGCDDGLLYALNQDGTLKWKFDAGAPIGSSPALADDGTVYCGADNGKFYALDANGTRLWDFQTTNYVFASPAIGPDGTIYVASADGALYVLRGRRPPMVSAWPMFRHDTARTARAAATITNRPPTLAAVADQAINAGQSLTFTSVATDVDVPAQAIHYSLAVGAPTGASVNEATGVFTWTPSAAQAASTNLIGIVAQDDGWPPLSDVRWFTVVVNSSSAPTVAATVVQGTVTLTWGAIPGRTYRVQFKDDLAQSWGDLPGDITADSPTATKTDPAGPSGRFYRVELLP